MRRGGEVRISALIGYAYVLFSILAGLLYTPWMIRTIGQAHYGLYTLATSLTAIFVFDFGMGSAVSKYLSNYYARNQYREAQAFLGVVYRLYLIAAAVIALLLTVAYLQLGNIYAQLEPGELGTLRTLYAIVATYSVLSFPFLPLSGVLLASEKLIALRLLALLQKVFTVGLIVTALLLGAGVVGLVAANAIGSLVFAGLRYLVVRRTAHTAADMSHWDARLATHVMKFSGWVTATQLAQRLMFNITPTILGVVAATPQIALFGLASSLEGYLFSATEALNGIFLSRISRILTQEEAVPQLLHLMVTVGRLQLYIVGLVVIGFACVGMSFVRVWLGPGYEAVYVGGLLVMLPALAEVPQQVAASAIVVSDNIRSQARVYAAAAAVNVALAFLLGTHFGATGACLGICISCFARSVLMSVVYRKRLGIDMVDFFRRTYGSWILPAAGSLAVGLLIGPLVPLSGWLGVAMKAITVGLVYMVAVVSLSFDHSERDLLRALADVRPSR